MKWVKLTQIYDDGETSDIYINLDRIDEMHDAPDSTALRVYMTGDLDEDRVVYVKEKPHEILTRTPVG